jgi:hypothetical protein
MIYNDFIIVIHVISGINVNGALIGNRDLRLKDVITESNVNGGCDVIFIFDVLTGNDVIIRSNVFTGIKND